MKKITLLLLLAVYSISSVFADNVNIEKAQKVAKNFIQQSNRYNDAKDVILAYTYEINQQSLFNPEEFEIQPILYVFDIGNNNGIIIISGDDIASPVLGYTASGSFDKENLPNNFRKWLDDYQDQILWALENNIEPTQYVKERWATLIEGNTIEDGSRALGPLCSTTWDQAPYYNAYCPGGSVTGCVATAMAQVMKYWNHPAQGTGMHSYNHNTYGTLSANFGATTYQWSQMPNSISSNNDAIATLMYHCGVSVNMDYSPQVSGAYVIENASPINECAERAFKDYFGYSSSLHGELRSSYSTNQWVQMLYADLDAGRPLVYAGFGSGGGHAFVCDGYDAGDYFHFNWGWGGYYDGFFHIDALNPGGTGTGGGTGGYNANHQAIFGMIPETTSGNTDLALYSSLTVSPSSISMGDAFSVQAAIGNFGTSNFSGDFTAWIFDNNGYAVDYVEILNTNLTAGYYNTYTFSTSGIASLLPGSYFISLYYRNSGGNWTKVGDGSYTNNAALTIENETADISLYSSFYLSSGTDITVGEPLSVILDILNSGATTFYGSFNVSLYDLDGNWIETIETLSGAALDPGYYYDDVEFYTAGVSVQPGSYLLALQHQATGGNWQLSGGSSSYANPIEVIVKAQGEAADLYESNDTENTSTNLSANFSGNTASVYTTGSNIHSVFDYDYYSINLPSGYDYIISARAHDSYNSGNGQTYTNDVLWSYKTGLYWSNAYDDIMMGTINVYNGGVVKFLVASYFLGNTGTYLMDIQITRSPLGLDDFADYSDLNVYPNPANEVLNISTNSQEDIQSVTITDVLGNIVLSLQSDHVQNNNYSLDVSELNSGTYIVSVVSNGKKWNQKFVKTQ